MLQTVLKDYFACDAGCLDPPVKLSTEPKTFPVKLTDPVTAVLYITSDQLHMQELKHAIHVKELVLGESLRIWTIFTWLNFVMMSEFQAKSNF
jgi:hypothetical protein